MLTIYRSDGKKDDRFDSRGNGFPVYCKFHRIDYGQCYFYIWTMDQVYIEYELLDKVVVHIPEPTYVVGDENLDRSLLIDPELLIYLRSNCLHKPLNDLLLAVEEFKKPTLKVKTISQHTKDNKVTLKA